jgi:pyruvate ferredoxin oxidoreductase gamma subunit
MNGAVPPSGACECAVAARGGLLAFSIVGEPDVMIGVRFHGRGGHGIKTASRILGTAAFQAGFQVQDCPVYGAERRGAAIAAFTRISREPIAERGPIERPDLIVVGDETLLDDPAAAVLAGQEGASAVFVNAESADGLAAKYGVLRRVVVWDVTGRTIAALGRASALSAGLAAAAARLIGVVAEGNLQEAVREELTDLRLDAEVIEKNVRLTMDVFAALTPIELVGVTSYAKVEMHPVGYDGPVLGAPSVLDAGNAQLRHTGTWRVERPEIDYARCTRCGLCYVQCPDGAIALDEEGYPVIDYDHCKGCMICRQVCPIEGIEAKREVRAW